MKLSEGLATRWERLSEREQRLALGAVIAAVVIIFFLLVTGIVSKLDGIQENNAMAREALGRMADHRTYGLPNSGPQGVQLPKEEVGLEAFLDEAISRTNQKAPGEEPLVLKTKKRLSDNKRNGYLETRVETSLRGITLTQAATLLQEIETPNEFVRVTDLEMRSLRAGEDNVSLRIVVSGYSELALAEGGSQ